MEIRQTLGSLLRARRKKLKLTTEELAKRAAIDRTYITKIEKDNKLPSPVIMEKICNVLVDDDLFKIYLKIKYPMFYKKIKRLDDFLGRELQEIRKEINSEDKSPRATTHLMLRVRNFEAMVQKSKDRLQKLTEKLEELEKDFAT